MPIQLPSQLGIIVRKSHRTKLVIEQLKSRAPHLFRGNEDAHLAGFWLAGSSQQASQFLDEIIKEHVVQEGIDFVATSSVDGILSKMPGWLQEDEEGMDMFSVPGTGGAPRTTVRLTMEQVWAQQDRERRLSEIASLREARALAHRRWPDSSTGGRAEFLGECWALVEFVEASRTGGPARSWVEKSFPAKRWHISVHHGYVNELRDLLKNYYQSDESPSALVRLRKRAGQYVAALEAGATKGTVDLECFEAWKRSRFGDEEERQL